MTLPATGPHVFNLRVKGQDGTWSNLFKHAIQVTSTTITTRDLKVTEAEYFWDTDPGEGSATPILASDGALNEAIENLLDNATIPSLGPHVFNLRIKGQDGTWSNLFRHAIQVTTTTIATRDLKIIQAEYFWDVDPGQGNATPILASDGALDEAVEELFTNSTTLPAVGAHVFNIRVMGVDGTWSSLFQHSINVTINTVNTRAIQITEAEYFWDSDPGEGSGFPLIMVNGNLDEALECIFEDLTAFPSDTGVHLFNICLLYTSPSPRDA